MYGSTTSNDFSTQRKATENSIVNLRMRESPNYQSIMDIWTETVHYAKSNQGKEIIIKLS